MVLRPVGGTDSSRGSTAIPSCKGWREPVSVWLGCGRLLDSLAPLVMSDLHFSVAATSSLSPDFSSKMTT